MKYSNYILLIILSCFWSCKSEYQKYIDRELDKGMVEDSLIFGMKLGQTKKDFFAICWELNNQKVISQGTGNQTARFNEPYDPNNPEYLTKDLLFYGIFDDNDIMRGMDMTYAYNAWALWNKKTHADSLALVIKDKIMKDYGGNPFMSVDIDLNSGQIQKTFVKIDGRRQILIYPKNDKDVAVKIEDIHYKYNLK